MEQSVRQWSRARIITIKVTEEEKKGSNRKRVIQSEWNVENWYMQSWGNATWHSPKWSNQKHWVGGLGESGRVRLKGGVPQQPWHNADGLFSFSLSGSDLTWLRGLPTPTPTPNPQTNHLAHLQMCNSKRHPAREPRHQNKPRIATWHRHRSNSLLIWTVKYWLIRIPPGISKNGWLSGLHVHQRDTTSWFEHGANWTRV